MPVRNIVIIVCKLVRMLKSNNYTKSNDLYLYACQLKYVYDYWIKIQVWLFIYIYAQYTITSMIAWLSKVWYQCLWHSFISMVLSGKIAACSSKHPKMVALKAVTMTTKLGKKASCLKNTCYPLICCNQLWKIQ